MIGVGYYWAINRSMDVTYRVQDFTERGFAHHIDFRGKPTQTSDFDLIFLGVNDRGVPVNGGIDKAPGVSVYGVGRTDLGGGWTGRATINYLSSLKFRQEFTESFNEAIFSESISVGYLTKHFDAYTINAAFSRIENFQDATPGNSVVIRKLPDVEFAGRDQQIASGPVPAWFSFDSSFGLLHRVQPEPNDQKPPGFYETSQFSTRADVEPAITTAFHWRGFNLVPSFILHETFYGQSFSNGAVTSNNLLRSAPELFIDFTTPALERVFNKKTFLGDKLKHVIEPRFTYRYVTGIENFDKVIRFDDLDLLSNTNEVEIGITNRLYAKRGDSVNEIFTWELYQKRFFDPTFGGAVIPGQRNVVLSTLDLTGYAFLDQPRNYSPIASILRTSPRPGVGIQWQLDYDPLRGGVANSMFSADVRIKHYFFSAGHNQVRSDPVLSPPANQVRGIFGYGDPNRKGWSAAFSAVYDYRIGSLQFATTQVTYNTDCCGISFQFRRFNFGSRNENQFRVAFAISNVGTFGTLKKQERLF
jgi:LPS-assembly protein